MKYDEQKKIEVFAKCTILILEDDEELSKRISNLIGRYTQNSPIVAHNIEQAKNILIDNEQNIDLVILDIMLPETNDQHKEIMQLENNLKIVNAEIKAAINDSSDDEKNILITKRFERSVIISEIKELINLSAGITLVEEWRTNNITFPILFLTAVGDNGIVENALSIAGEKSSWIIKPSPSEKLLNKCAELLINWKK